MTKPDNDLNELIASAEKSVEAQKEARKEDIKAISRGEEAKTATVKEKTAGNWEDWSLDKFYEETPQDKQIKKVKKILSTGVLILVCVFALLFILISNDYKDGQKERLPLSNREYITESQSKVVKYSDGPRLPGYENGVLYHNGEASAEWDSSEPSPTKKERPEKEKPAEWKTSLKEMTTVDTDREGNILKYQNSQGEIIIIQ